MLLTVALVFLSVQLAVAHNSYMMVFPKKIRPGMQFDCHITRRHKAPRLYLSASIGISYRTPVVSGDFEIAEKSDTISLQLPNNISHGSYRFEVKAKDRFGIQIFYNTSYLSFNSKKLSLFVQTDKAIYKPGQAVKFRVFAINSDLDVLKDYMDIDIFDPSGNRISQWKNVSADSGVFQGEMVMSSQPPLGEWSIVVFYTGKEKTTKRFTVEEFVLPKFEVTLSTPGFGVMTDPYLSGTVGARYTFGKGVEGNGTLVVKKKYVGYKEEEKKYVLNFKIDADYKFQIDRDELFKVIGITYPTTIEMNVNVTETLTGNTQAGSADLQYYSRREKLAFLTGSRYFRPGLKTKAYVLLSDQKGRPLASDNIEIAFSAKLFSVNNSDVNGRQINVTVPVKKNGIAGFEFWVPRSVNSLTMSAKYQDLSAVKYMEQFRSPTSTYLQLELVTKNVKLGLKIHGIHDHLVTKEVNMYPFLAGTNLKKHSAGRNARFRIRSSKAKKTVYYLIAGRDGLIHTGQVFLTKRKKTITIQMTAEMAPNSMIIAYYMRRNGEIVADSIKFNVEGVFKNKVNLRFNRKTVKPGKDVSLIMRADPGSQCNVLAVDKSILLLKKGNDITPDMVTTELSAYDVLYHKLCSSYTCMEKYFYAPIEARDVNSIFLGTGLGIFTNGFLYRYYQPRPKRPTSSTSSFYDYYSTMSSASMTFMTSTMMAATVSSASSLSSASFTTSEPEESIVMHEPKAPPPKVRSLFPDTWIYSNDEIADRNGKCYFQATVPDTITSWVATAFAVNNQSGLGIAPDSANLNVLLKFFIRLELPYSVTRGEQLILKASIFNFFTVDLKVSIRLKKSDCFENIVVSQSNNGSSVLKYTQKDITREMMISADSAITLNFPIKPSKVGSCEINIQALSSRASDAVKQQLLVKAEGIEEGYNIPFLVEPHKNFDFYAEQPITLPDDVILDSVKIRVSVVGDLMGPTITGLTKLLRMPYGCGEQNMITFVPNIFVVDYLDAIESLTIEDLKKGKLFMTSGYQRQLTYQHTDGSFSAFGNRDPSGSTWLTAFVIKSFAQAARYIYIDPNNMERAMRWILNQYDPNTGVMKEPGRVIHKDMQGGTASGDTNLLAYTLIALLETKAAGFEANVGSLLTLVTNSSIKSLENKVANMTNLFELAIVGYALVLGESDMADDVFDKLEDKAINEDGMKYWDAVKEISKPTSSWRPPYSQSRPRNVETNAYILLAYIAKGELSNALKVMKWLVKQRNSFGGYGSTQDTVIGLQALTAVAAAVFSPDFDLKIDINTEPGDFRHVFRVTKENALLFQAIFIPESTAVVKVTGSGEGVALLQISVTYNVMEDPVEPLFFLDIATTDETMDSFTLKACFSWLGDDISGMSVMEIDMLSGFTADQFSVTNLGIIKRVEEGENQLILYFDEITSQVECTEISFQRTSLVAGSQPAVVKLYDYYDPNNHVFALYQPKLLRNTNVCDIGGKELGCVQ